QPPPRSALAMFAACVQPAAGRLGHARDATSEMLRSAHRHFDDHRSVRADGGLSAPFDSLARPAIAGRGPADPARLLEATPARCGDGNGVALLHPLDPAEVEAAPGERDSDRARDVRASLGPVEAESAEVAAGRAQGGKVDPELEEETGAGRSGLGGLVAPGDAFAGDGSIGGVPAGAGP